MIVDFPALFGPTNMLMSCSEIVKFRRDLKFVNLILISFTSLTPFAPFVYSTSHRIFEQQKELNVIIKKRQFFR